MGRTSPQDSLLGCLLFLFSTSYSSSALKEEKASSLVANIHGRSHLKGNTRKDLAQPGISASSTMAEYLRWCQMMTPARYFNTKPCLVNRLNDAVSKHLP